MMTAVADRWQESEQALLVSKTTPICYAGQWLGAGQLARDEADAQDRIDRHSASQAAARDKNAGMYACKVGNECGSGIIYATRLVDGELTADVAKVVYTKATRSDYETRSPIASVSVSYDETVTAARPGRVDLAVREIARYVGYRKTRSVDSHERELHSVVRALADHAGQLTANPWTAYHADGNETTTQPVGLITARSALVGVGMWAHSHADLDREPDAPIQGGYLMAFDDHQRVYAAVGGPTRGGTELDPRILPERDIHLCTDGLCPMCPALVRSEGRRIFRAIHYWLGRGTGRLADLDYRRINTATTVMGTIL